MGQQFAVLATLNKWKSRCIRFGILYTDESIWNYGDFRVVAAGMRVDDRRGQPLLLLL